MSTIQCTRCHTSYPSVWRDAHPTQQGDRCCSSLKGQAIIDPIPADRVDDPVELVCGYGSNKDGDRYQIVDRSLLPSHTRPGQVRVYFEANLCDPCIDQLVAEGKLKRVAYDDWEDFDGVS